MGTNYGIRPYGNLKASQVWISVHDTTGRTGSTTVELNFGASIGDRTIDWGDGTVEVVNTAFPSHTYATDGEYVVTCWGGTTARLGERGTSPNAGWTDTLKSVKSWGLGFTSFETAFREVNGNFQLPKQIPSTVTNVSAMFNSATSFNQNISGWDMSSVEDMSDMFNNAISFNQPIGIWDTSSVTNMSGVFGFNSGFNQDISNWNTSNVTTLLGMFLLASNFNQDISSWDVSSVSNMNFLFYGASSFNKNLGDWSLRTAGVTMSLTFNLSGVATENYSRTLIGWANYVSANSDTPVVSLGASGRTYNNTAYTTGQTYNDAVSARAYLTGTAGWTISDGGEI